MPILHPHALCPGGPPWHDMKDLEDKASRTQATPGVHNRCFYKIPAQSYEMSDKDLRVLFQGVQAVGKSEMRDLARICLSNVKPVKGLKCG
eukprot:5189553-Amphidinium_carterae.1